MTNDLPLITFAIIAYNNERHVRDAVEGAFRQIYEPLQIVLSDDCSQDGTFDVMAGMAERYQGPHQIVLNRNQRNRGIGDHVNRVMELSEGEWVVIAAGDDLSMPERTSEIFHAIQSSHDKTMAAFSDLQIINERGAIQGEVSSRPRYKIDDAVEVCRYWFDGVPGASSAWNRSLFSEFGPLDLTLTFEDRVLLFRAALLGKICHIPKPLVRYRQGHGTNICAEIRSQSLADLEKLTRYFLPMFENCLRDLDTYSRRGLADPLIVRDCRREIRRSWKIAEGRLKILSGQPLEIVLGLAQLMSIASNPTRAVRLATRVLSEKWESTKTS